VSLTERLAQFTAQSRYETLAADVVTAVRRAVLDTAGVTVAGALEPAGRIARDRAARGSPGIGGDGASVLGTDVRATPAEAAWANGTLGHALDFDDVSTSMRGHPSVVVLPAALALAESRDASGRDLISAFAVGFEVECRVGRALGGSGYERGWHYTSVLGSLGAAAACARLLGLDAEAARHALGIAASMSCGSRQNFGSMTKPLHAGLAARAGVESAELAAAGFTADAEILDAPLGFGALFASDKEWNAERAGDPGKPWEIVDPGLSVKKYPCCFMVHSALDAVLAASSGEPLAEADIADIEVRVAEGSTSALIHPRPQTGLEGKFSMEYCVAAALLDGTVRLASFEDASVLRSDAQALLPRVREVHTSGASWHASAAEVVVKLAGGRELTGRVDAPRGGPQEPLAWDELTDKYRDCCSRVLPPDAIERSLALFENLESRPVRELTASLRTA